MPSMESIKKVAAWPLKLARSLWQFFVGGIIVAIGFISNFIDLKQPALTIEITEIQQRTAAEVDIRSSPAFAKYRELMSGDIGLSLSSPFRDSDPFKSLQVSVDRRVQQIADAGGAVARLRGISEKIPADFKSTVSDDDRRQRLQAVQMMSRDLDDIARFGDRLLTGLSAGDAKTIVDDFQARVDATRSLVKLAQDEIESFRAKSERTDAKIVVTAAVTNSGDGSTTLKPQALLRANLGQGNYLDINLKISNYDRSEVKPRGASIVRFESAPISQLAPQDQERFLSFSRTLHRRT